MGNRNRGGVKASAVRLLRFAGRSAPIGCSDNGCEGQDAEHDPIEYAVGLNF